MNTLYQIPFKEMKYSVEQKQGLHLQTLARTLNVLTVVCSQNGL